MAKIIFMVFFITMLSCCNAQKDSQLYIRGYTDGWNAHEKYNKDSLMIIDSCRSKR
jgi:hypothetical protein